MRFAGISLSNYMDGFDNTLLSNTSQQARSQENRASMIGEGKVSCAGIMGAAEIQAAKYGASAARSAGQAAGNAAMFGGAMDAVGTLGSAGISKFMSKPTYPGKTPDGYPLGRGSDGSYGGFGGKYGSFQPGSYTDYNPAIG